MTFVQSVVGSKHDIVTNIVELRVSIRPRLDVDIFKCDVKAWSRFTAGEIDDPITRSRTGEIVEMDIGPPVIQILGQAVVSIESSAHRNLLVSSCKPL